MDIQEHCHNSTESKYHPQNDGNGELPMNSSQSTTNQGVLDSSLDLTVKKKVVSQTQKIVSEEGSFQRRASPRLKSIPDSKKPYYGTARRDTVQDMKDSCKEEIIDVNQLVHKSSPNTSVKKGADIGNDSRNDHTATNVLQHRTSVKLNNEVAVSDLARPSPCSTAGSNHSNGSGADTLKWLRPRSSISNADAKRAIARVKETLKTYNSYYLHFFQEKQKKMEAKGQKAVAGSKRKKGDLLDKDNEGSRQRPDLKALTKMAENKEILCPEKRLGVFPGIDVGYRFFSRAEMVALGFHSHWMNGIDFIPKSSKRLMSSLQEFKDYTFPLAVTIVLSGQYEDDVDNLEDVVYTGQGGNKLLGQKSEPKDQTLSSGNLALKNNMEQSVPVRVVRGQESKKDKLGKTYTYDGLYKVVDFWSEKGSSGFVVYKYRLRRLEGQPKLTSNQVHFSRSHGSKASLRLTGVVAVDISGGQEELCIPATNVIEDPPVPPAGFTYSKSNQVAENINLPPNAEGCKCKGKCTNPRECSCARLNGSDFPYVKSNGGRLFEAKDVVYECGPNCGCGPDCINRISQRGIKYHLEVFRTPQKGWAVRSRDSIPSGAPVCEYIGVLRKTDELDNVSGNEYIFEIDCLHTVKEIGGRERRLGNTSLQFSDQLEKIDEKMSDNTPEFCIDAGSVGNIARFINHSCEPNLFVQCVLSSHHDARLARVVLFAAENIAPSEELTYDYGYALDSVVGSDGEIKQQPCHCGTDDCRKRLY